MLALKLNTLSLNFLAYPLLGKLADSPFMSSLSCVTAALTDDFLGHHKQEDHGPCTHTPFTVMLLFSKNGAFPYSEINVVGPVSFISLFECQGCLFMCSSVLKL